MEQPENLELIEKIYCTSFMLKQYCKANEYIEEIMVATPLIDHLFNDVDSLYSNMLSQD